MEPVEVPEWGWLVLGAGSVALGAGFVWLEVVEGIKHRRHSTFTESVHRRVKGWPFPLRFALAGAGVGFGVWVWIHLLFPGAPF